MSSQVTDYQSEFTFHWIDRALNAEAEVVRLKDQLDEAVIGLANMSNAKIEAEEEAKRLQTAYEGFKAENQRLYARCAQLRRIIEGAFHDLPEWYEKAREVLSG